MLTRRLGAAGGRTWGRLAGTVAASLFLAACTSLSPPLPTPGPAARLPPIGESVITVHIGADYAAMSAAANAAVPVKVFELPSVDLGHAVTFRLGGMRSDILVARTGDEVGFSSFVYVDGDLDSPCALLLACSGSVKVDGQVWGAVRPTIHPDWSIDWAPSGHFVINDAVVRSPLFPAAVSLKAPLTAVLQGPFNDLVSHVDDQLSSSTALKAKAQAAWSGLGRVIPVSASPPVWLSVNPIEILTEQPRVTDQGVEMSIALVAEPELVLGDRPADRDPGPLPRLAIVDKAPDQFSLYLPVRLSYVDATELAQQVLVGKSLQAGGGVTVSVDEVSIFDNGDEVGVKLAFHARSSDGTWKPSGTVYLLGAPVYHLEDGYIAIEHLHFDVRTQDAILQVAAWLAHQALLDDLQARLRFDVRSQVDARRQDLAHAIANIQLNPHVSVSGEVLSLAPSAVYLTRDFLQVNVVALGTLKVSVH